MFCQQPADGEDEPLTSLPSFETCSGAWACDVAALWSVGSIRLTGVCLACAARSDLKVTSAHLESTPRALMLEVPRRGGSQETSIKCWWHMKCCRAAYLHFIWTLETKRTALFWAPFKIRGRYCDFNEFNLTLGRFSQSWVSPSSGVFVKKISGFFKWKKLEFCQLNMISDLMQVCFYF